VPTLILLATFIFDIQSTTQTAYFETFKAYGPWTVIPLLLAHALTAGIVEEITYRGFIQNTLTRSYHKWLSILLVAFIFALMHFLPLPLLIPYVMVSILFSLVAEKTKSTGAVIHAHVLIDFVVFLFIYYDLVSLTQITFNHVVISLALMILGMNLLFFDMIRSKKRVSQLNVG
jgi:membrane protease YdiL (CAAX protease family)